MARRKQNFAEDWIEITSKLPWWMAVNEQCFALEPLGGANGPGACVVGWDDDSPSSYFAQVRLLVGDVTLRVDAMRGIWR